MELSYWPISLSKARRFPKHLVLCTKKILLGSALSRRPVKCFFAVNMGGSVTLLIFSEIPFDDVPLYWLR